jgi:fumarate reductase flavoprotein subunit
MHLGEAFLKERLPFICELSETFLGIDPVKNGIPVCPSAHYTMGGIQADGNTTATPLAGLYACGECSSVGIHGANRLGSNSLAELSVFGGLAGRQAAQFAQSVSSGDSSRLLNKSKEAMQSALALLEAGKGDERLATLRNEMTGTMSEGVGIFRTEDAMQATCDKIAELRGRYSALSLDDHSRVFNTEWLTAIELGFMLDVAEAVSWSALERKESRGAHQRLDEFGTRDDENFLKHSVARYQADGSPQISFEDVNITRLPPAERVYGANAEKKAAADPA